MREELPALAAIERDVGAADRDVHVVRVARVDLDRLYRRPSFDRPTRHSPPELAVFVLVDRIHGLPRGAPVLAAEEAGRRSTGEDDAGLALVTRTHVPHGIDGEAHVFGEAQPFAPLVPRLAPVQTLRKGRAPDAVLPRRVEPGRVRAEVGSHVEDLPAGQDRLRKLPLLSLLVGGVDEGGLLRPDQDAHLTGHNARPPIRDPPAPASSRWRGEGCSYTAP